MRGVAIARIRSVFMLRLEIFNKYVTRNTEQYAK